METLQQLISKIESYHFECEAGPLTGCLHWAELKAKIAALESDITRHVQIATDQANEIAKLEEKRKADVRKCEEICAVSHRLYAHECARGIRAAFPEVFP